MFWSSSHAHSWSRFKSPQICEKVIQCFHGKKISNGTDFTILQLRYADTNQQKMLKMETNHRRVFKANEYNTVVYGTGSHYFESPLSSMSMSPLHYAPSQHPSVSTNNHNLYSSPKVLSDGNQPNLSYYFRNMIRNPVPSPVEQNRASWMRMQTPEPQNFSINVGRKFPNRSAPISHSDDVFSHWFRLQRSENETVGFLFQLWSASLLSADGCEIFFDGGKYVSWEGGTEFAFGTVIPALHSAGFNDGPVYEQLRL